MLTRFPLKRKLQRLYGACDLEILHASIYTCVTFHTLCSKKKTSD